MALSLQIDTANLNATDIADEASFLYTKSPSSTKSPHSPGDGHPSVDIDRSPSKGKRKTRAESRKLLLHILMQLQVRTMPPSVYDSYTNPESTVRSSGAGAIVGTMIDAMKRKGSIAMASSQTTAEEDSDDDTGHVYSTDNTYDLMLQLRNVLLVSAAQGWKIFDDELDEDSKITYLRRIRSTYQDSRSFSYSPVRGSHVLAPELLTQCVSVLVSVIQEDCRYRTARPRPFRPPNALHVLCLDVAQFLLSTQQHNPQIVSQIAYAMIPALSTFPREMHEKLLKFFEECILWGPIQGLHVFQTGSDQDSQIWQNNDNIDDNKASVMIHIDQVDDDSLKFNPSHRLAVLSTSAPSQPRSIYHLSLIVPPLLAAILENVNILDGYELYERFKRLFHAISQLKYDACNDLLQVIAYHTPGARLLACSVLITSWRAATGHLVVSEPLTDIRISAHPRSNSSTPSLSHSHQFVPWRFSSLHRPNPNGCLRGCCHSCTDPIVDFGLVCPLCMCSVHFDCYDYHQGCSLVQYTVDREIQKMAMYRFCRSISNERTSFQVQQHDFHFLNIFTLCLCFNCRKPLWGCFSQGIGCISCSIFFHSDCLNMPNLPSCGSRVIDSSHINITWEELRSAFMDYYSHIFSMNQSDLERCSYEEVAIYFAIFWIQFQILANGIALGSIVLTQGGRNISHISQMHEFEFHAMLQRCQALLEADGLISSQSLCDYHFENRLSRREHNLMFDWSCLIFISTIIRGSHHPAHTSQPGSPKFLHAENLEASNEHNLFEDSLCNVAPIGHVNQVLALELNIVSEFATRHLLECLAVLGFLQKEDNPNGPLCIFGLPFGFDSSVEVEILISAIEACLSDENLSVNEVGFLLLVRRLLPNGMSSEYTLRRLSKTVIAWILNEEVAMESILRDFVANQEGLPGVPLDNKSVPWPERPTLRPPISSNPNGGDYVTFRRALHSRYAMIWLLSFHDQDPTLYGEILYDACVDFEISESAMDGTLGSNRHQNILRCIIKLLQASVVYTAFDDLISRWMESASRSNIKEPMTSLHRVFELERNNVIRFSSSSDSASMNAEGAESLAIDPWRPILALAGQGRKELSRALNWLNLLASGGVHISTIHLLRFVSFVSEEKDLRNAIAIIDAAFKNAWLNPVGRRDLLAVFSKLHVDFSSIVVSAADNDRDLSNVLQFIRRSLASCLLLFGCDRKRLIQLEMITDDETRGLLLRKRSDPRRSLSADPITIDAGMMSALERYIDVNHDDISCVVAIFFNALYAEASFMEAYEVDNFVLRNGQILAKSAWQLYNIQRPALYEIRASLLSRTIVVDSQPFRDISISYLRPTITWEKRLSAVARLFRIVQDVTNPALDVEGRHWRSSIANILCIYLSALWTDDKEEIRLAVKTSASSLLPAHVQALESCWVELLLTAPVQERVELVSFLLHVLSYFPHWQVLSWSAIIDTLSEGKYDITRREEDPNVISLRVTLLLISLHMITNGVNVNVSTLLKVKKYLADLVGFHNVVEVLQLDGQIVRIDFGDVPTVYDEATPCVNELTAIFDCLFSFELTPSMMTHSYGQDDKSSNLAVGSLFIDLILVLFCTLKDLSSLPVLTLKRTLESLCIIIYKHDFEGPVLVHLQHRLRLTVSRSLELIQQDIGYELRQVALSFIQGFIKQCDKFMGHVIYKVIEDLSKLITAESHHASDVLTVQAKNFLNDIFDAYGWNGLFANLFKRPLQRDFFMILKENFGNGGKDGVDKANRLLRDIMSRMLDFDRDSFQTALQNLLTYIEVVYREDYDTGTMTFVGQQLTQLARRMPGEDINLSPLFSIPSIVAENNQGKINAIIPYIENEIRFIFQRLPVAFDDVFRLFSATQSLQRRNDSVIFSNGMAQIVFDALEDGLRTKQKMQPSSLTSLLQLVIYDDNPEWLPLAVTYPRLFLGLADNALYFLQSYEWPDTKLEDAYTASLSAAMVIWRAIDDDARVMDKLALLGSEKLVPGDYRIRAWNLIALAALRYSNKKCATALLPLLPVFASIQFNALRGYVYSEAMNWDQATVNINHAYVAVKLWMLIACETARDMADGAAIATARVWNELWPPFETLAFNAEKQNGHPSLTLLISSSVADLFIFLHSLHTPLSLQTTLRIATLDRLKTMASMGSASRKVTRAIHNLSQPPISLPSEVLVDQASKEIVAAEKLRVLETKREVD